MPMFGFMNRKKSAATPGKARGEALAKRKERMKRQISVDAENEIPGNAHRRDSQQTRRRSSVSGNVNRPALAEVDNLPPAALRRDKKLKKSNSTCHEDKGDRTVTEIPEEGTNALGDGTSETKQNARRVSKSGHYRARLGSKSNQKRRKSSTLEETWDMTQLCLSMESMLITTPPPKRRDIDDQDDDPFNCPIYAKDILQYLMSLESKFRVPPRYLKRNTEISTKIRAILVDWLIQIQVHFNLLQETLHLSVSMIDIFVHKRGVTLANLQLLGITCLLIAAKYEERFHPSMEDLVKLTDNCYRVRDVVKMEIIVLKAFNFEIFLPTPFDFLARMLKVIGNPHPKLEPMARYLLDLSLPDVTLAHLAPSLKAAAAVCFSIKILEAKPIIPQTPPSSEKTSSSNKVKLGQTKWYSVTDSVDEGESWTPDLSYHSGYSETVLQGCMQRYAKLLLRAEHSSLQGARCKYSSKRKFDAISLWPVLSSSEVVRSTASG